MKNDFRLYLENKNLVIMPAGARALCLAISIACGCIVWGVLISLPPPFYPTEAERKGATASQVNSIDKSIWSKRSYILKFTVCINT